MLKLNQIINLAIQEEHISDITENKVLRAKEIIATIPKNNNQLFQVLVAMNLINAALKRLEFKRKEKDAIIHYGMLKPRVSRLFHTVINNREQFDIDFYIDTNEKCAYIEIDDLQFGFHNIIIDEALKVFSNSPLNNPKPWKEIKLQKIAGELFDYCIDSKESIIIE